MLPDLNLGKQYSYLVSCYVSRTVHYQHLLPSHIMLVVVTMLLLIMVVHRTFIIPRKLVVGSCVEHSLIKSTNIKAFCLDLF